MECLRYCGPSAEAGRDVRVDFCIDRQHVNHHLHFVIKTIRKQRAQRPIDQAGRQRFFLRRPPFTLKEAAWIRPAAYVFST